MTHTHCPRCMGALGTNPARSRVTVSREILICTTCGTDEAERDYRREPPIPPEDWPLTR
ncbi:hypothetical protein [Streptacidiphilus sp. MAP5-3]|uniref:hypothetical protein n=1 Tax=unclassified Streptacidiphilus TaxID=2643834 RepID=UPI003515B043